MSALRDPTVLLRQHVLEQPADELQRDVLEREGRPVEQLLDEVVVTDLHEWHDCGVGERRVGVGTHCPQRVCPDLVADESLHDPRSAVGVAHARLGRRQ